MNENLNLGEILKDCPKGTKLYSPAFGYVELVNVSQDSNKIDPIEIKTILYGTTECFTVDGRIYAHYNGECLLFPSKDQRDWSKFNVPDKIEPKFKVGDWIVFNGFVLYVKEVVNGFYITISKGGIPNSYDWDIDNIARLWTIKDAKDGDILCCKSGWMCVFKTINNHTNTFSSYCFIDSDKLFYNSGCEGHTRDKEFIKTYNGEIHPATKEQRDALMKAMNDAGYEWNVEKKELRRRK